MAKYEFRFVVSDVELSDEESEKVSRAVAQAGALALAEYTPDDAVTVMAGPNVWWRGIPAARITKALQKAAIERVNGKA